MFGSKIHNHVLYNTLLNLSRNILFYNKIGLPDTFETRIYLMFFHFSIIMLIFKEKKTKFDQKLYDNLFHDIENNLREAGLGDVSVNKKMKDLNKQLYDIIIKFEKNKNKGFDISKNLAFKYFKDLDTKEEIKYNEFNHYFIKFYNFCFELPLDNMIREAIKFKI